MQLSEDETEEHLFGVILASHYSLKKGIELFGDKATNTTSAELEKIHRMGTYEPMYFTKLTHQQRQQALHSLLFMTKKGMVVSK